MSSILEELGDRCTLLSDANVIDVDAIERTIKIENNENIYADIIVFAVGRSGNSFLQKWCESKSHVKTTNRNVDIGVRVELKNSVWEKISAIAYDPKISYISKNIKMKQGCFVLILEDMLLLKIHLE